MSRFIKLTSKGRPLPVTAPRWSQVQDTHTGLIWLRDALPAENWQEAMEAATACRAGGFLWRAPERDELLSLTDVTCYDPAIDIDFFDDAPGPLHWSSSPYADLEKWAWAVRFTGGTAEGRHRNGIGLIRPVRRATRAAIAPDGAARFTKLTDAGHGLPSAAKQWSQVLDRRTGLIWTASSLEAHNWQHALSAAAGCTLGGFQWRAPERGELISITDITRHSPAIDTAFFPDRQRQRSWSATPRVGGPRKAWLFNFATGSMRCAHHSAKGYVRPVRTATAEDLAKAGPA